MRALSTMVRAAFLVVLAVACEPPGAAGLEVYLRSDLSEAERADVRFTIHVTPVGGMEDAAPAFMVSASSLSIDDLASVDGAFLGRFEELPVERYQVSLDLRRGSGAETRADFAAVDFRGEGAQQVVFLLLRSGGASCDADTPCAEAPCASAECISGSCFEVRDADWTDACECDEAADCPAGSGCGAAQCVSHACQVVPDDARCGGTERCRTDFTCDSVTCRGRGAGDVCRGASSACDAPETCASGSTDCPADVSLELGAGCIDDDSMLPGFCTAPSGAAALLCDTRCEAGRPCQLGCLSGIQVCAPVPMCDTSSGATVADATSCGTPQLCREAPTCQAGVCTLGTPTVDVVCGEDPAPDCVAAPRCTAAGSCEPTPAPTGTPCTVIGPGGMPAVPAACFAFSCSASGVCAASPIPADSRCDGVYEDCGGHTCSPERVSGRWGCNPQPADDLCALDYCDSYTHCEFTNTMDRGPFYECQDWGELRCRRSDGTFTACDYGESCDQALCANGALDPGESDADCGGGYCPGCAAGDTCNVAFDCASSVCTSGTCE